MTWEHTLKFNCNKQYVKVKNQGVRQELLQENIGLLIL